MRIESKPIRFEPFALVIEDEDEAECLIEILRLSESWGLDSGIKAFVSSATNNIHAHLTRQKRG